MADINSEPVGGVGKVPRNPDQRPLTDRDARLITVVELIFFAYRDFTREADAVLAEFGLGRAHHRVLHFVNRNPGLRVANLLDILKITKQSLARVLKDLLDEGWIAQQTGKHDRRERLLRVTDRGSALATRLDQLQAKRVKSALAACGPESEALIRKFLFNMISLDERALAEALLAENSPSDAGR